MADSYSIRAPRIAHDTLNAKLARANIRRAKSGKPQLSKGDAVTFMAQKITIKDLAEA